jgi:threonine aldolase
VYRNGNSLFQDEIKALADFAHDNRMFLHVDGARIANAVAAAGITVKEMLTDTGVDFVSFCGTKNGLMMGEAVIFLNPELSQNMKYIRKQSMQLVSKMRFISAQFLAYLENDLWLENARAANNAGKYFKERLEKIPEISILGTVDANIIFAVFPQHVIDQLLPLDYFYVMDPLERKVRFVTSFNTRKEDIDSFILKLKNPYKNSIIS